MKKMRVLLLFVALSGVLSAQTAFDPSWPETYVQTVLSKSQLELLSSEFNVDRVVRRSDSDFEVRLCVPCTQYEAFERLEVPYQVASSAKASVSMASTYQDLVASWNKYPTYSAYLETMQTFQTQFPNLCKIDTILAQTPNNHAILVAHISNDLNDRAGKPSFFYSSTMHGDEPVGYYLMLHLIDYLLNNYASDSRVRGIVDQIDIWICPLENPDGTYHTSDNTLNESPVSTRYNANYVDLNRTYPLAGESVVSGTYESEVQAMMDFGAAHPFTLSANLHGGAEVFNYPWDSWTTSQRQHADDDWWQYVGHNFADTCQAVNGSYMNDEDDGVTPGGDWYVITGSRQDYFNYFMHCREVTIEASTNKVVASNNLPDYWNRIYRSLLNYMEECLYGFCGVVTDSISGQPLEAKIYVLNHDRFNSEVYSHLPYGDYHRPIKSGSYQVTYSAEGYQSKTLLLTATDGQCLTQDVQLVPLSSSVAEHTGGISIFPNPADEVLHITDALGGIQQVALFDAMGRQIRNIKVNEDTLTLELDGLVPGIYLIHITTSHGFFTRKVMIR